MRDTVEPDIRESEEKLGGVEEEKPNQDMLCEGKEIFQ